jgi:serine protease
MRSSISLSLLFILSFFLAACSSSDDDSSSPVPLPIETPPEPVLTSTLNGTINVATNIVRDGDLNDRNTPFSDNSSLSNAQEIPNIVSVQGFATITPTIEFDSFEDDRFYTMTDENDYYIAQMQAGQVIQLQVVNHDSATTDTIFYGDLDLHIIHHQTGESFSSVGTDEFETLIIPESGLYYIFVEAFDGASRYVLTIRQPVTTEPMPEITSTSRIAHRELIPNELIIQFSDTIQARTSKGELASLTTRHPGKSRATLATLSNTRAAHVAQINSSSNSSMLELANQYPETYEALMTIRKMKTLSRSQSIRQVSLNYWRHPLRIPADPFYQYQWHYPAMNLPQAWDITTGTPDTGSVVVAVIDTGIISSHPDLSNQLVSGYDFISNDENARDDEPGIDNIPEDPGDSADLGSSSWHGTHVAGTIAAQSNNGTGVAGVSWGAKIMPIRALGQFGGSTYDIMQAVRFAAGLANDSGTVPAKPADIINLSLGGGGYSSTEEALFEQLFNDGIIVVAAAGNDNSDELFYPASYKGVFSVSAIGSNRQRAPYSNYGSMVDIAAPGGDLSRDANRDGRPDGVLSTFLDDSTGIRKPIYAQQQGTSMAAPHVSGMFALMKAVHPALSGTSINTLLTNELLTDPAGVNGRDDFYGYGIANALKAVQEAVKLENGASLPESPPILQATPANLIFTPEQLSARLDISNQGGGDVSVDSISVDSSWLNILPSSQPGKDSLASFTITANPENLSAGFYFGKIEFLFDNAPSLTVNVTLSIGLEDTGGHLAQIYINLFDIDLEEVILRTRARNNNSGALVFNFNEVPQGRYIIVAGTNIDNDEYICQLAEGCAVYPPSSQINPIDTSIPGTFAFELTANILSTQEVFINQAAESLNPIAQHKALQVKTPATSLYKVH